MKFDQTGLPEKPLYHAAFDAGWERFCALHPQGAAALYLAGPAAMARLVMERGGDCRQVAVAACLAGPALFSADPDPHLDPRLCAMARALAAADGVRLDTVHDAVTRLDCDARLFLQAGAILLLDGLARGEGAADGQGRPGLDFLEALALYAAARGAVDTYGLDTRFEIAARKVSGRIGAHDGLAARAGIRVLEDVRAL